MVCHVAPVLYIAVSIDLYFRSSKHLIAKSNGERSSICEVEQKLLTIILCSVKHLLGANVDLNAQLRVLKSLKQLINGRLTFLNDVNLIFDNELQRGETCSGVVLQLHSTRKLLLSNFRAC